MRFELGRELRAFGVLDRDEILDPQRVEHLPAEAFGDDAGADALARRIDGGGGAAGAAADDEHVERLLRGDLFGGAGDGAGVELDRKSVVEGQSVSVSVDLGGRRTIKKKT